jgi:hypothetical protein
MPTGVVTEARVEMPGGLEPNLLSHWVLEPAAWGGLFGQMRTYCVPCSYRNGTAAGRGLEMAALLIWGVKEKEGGLIAFLLRASDSTFPKCY